jgi:hypothetical protein
MAILFRRLVMSLLVPYLWKRWRERSRTSTTAAAPR